MFDQIWQFASSALGLGYGLIGHVIMAFALSKMAERKHIDNGWFAWIPVLNVILALQIARKPLWMIVLFLIPCINIVMFIALWWSLAEEMRKPGIIGLLMFFPIINLVVPLYLAYSD